MVEVPPTAADPRRAASAERQGGYPLVRLTPRKEEIDGVKTILESDDFTSADQMAKALIKEVAEMLWMRDWFALVHIGSAGKAGLNWAPFASPVEALNMAEKIAIGGRFGTVKLFSPGVLLGNTLGKPNWKGFCRAEGCGHAPFLHLSDGNARGACGLASMCTCKKYTK
ncbi:hypothetical protein [Actinoplanes sp. NPDC049265]|uniref:hypothetical protein n=1 Tax=Actinoplanes sp. NPDC049265 TaxID=3363902 RepID=UPI0037128A5C